MKKIFTICLLILSNFGAANAQYCTPYEGQGGCGFGELIDDFILYGENGTFIFSTNTGCSQNAYADFTAESVSLGQGVTYTATMSSGSSPQTHAAIWIDFNDDQVFDSTEFVGGQYDIMGSGTPVNIAIPAAAPVGSHRMRVSLRFNVAPADMDPCNTGTFSSESGEAHDYSVVIVPAPTCLPPTSITTSAVNQAAATISWNGTAAQYGIEYGLAGFTPGTGTYLSSASTSVTINGLNNSSAYTVYVRSVCSNIDSSAVISTYFTTLCPAVNVPYLENFDGVTMPDIPACMRVEDANNDSVTWWSEPFISNSAPNGMAYVSFIPSSANDWIFTPGLNMVAGTAYQVSFKYATSGMDESIEVKTGNAPYSTAMDTTAHFISTTLNDTAFQTVTFTYTPAVSGEVYFGWHIFTPNPMGFIMDDITITELTTSNCDTSLTLTATGVTGTSANLAWSTVTGASGYEYVLDQTAAIPTGAGTTTTATTYNAVSLTSNTTYYFHVRTACGTAFSDWKTVSFTTAPVSVGDVNSSKGDIRIYPNPVKDVVNIELPMTASKASMQLADISGKVLQIIDVNGTKAQADMSRLAPGIYIIRYTDNTHNRQVKVVKE